MALNCDLKTFPLQSLRSKFDVVVIDPPWREYEDRTGGLGVYNEVGPDRRARGV